MENKISQMCRTNTTLYRMQTLKITNYISGFALYNGNVIDMKKVCIDHGLMGISLVHDILLHSRYAVQIIGMDSHL